MNYESLDYYINILFNLLCMVVPNLYQIKKHKHVFFLVSKMFVYSAYYESVKVPYYKTSLKLSQL